MRVRVEIMDPGIRACRTTTIISRRVSAFWNYVLLQDYKIIAEVTEIAYFLTCR